MEPHIVDDVGVQGLKGAQPDVQRDPGDPGPPRAARVENPWREMESGRRGCYRPSLARKHRLIAFPIGGSVGSAYIRRERDVPRPFENIE
jgi:hypothetical protein